MSMNGYLSLACGWLANDSGYTPQSAVVVSRLGIRRTCVIENKWMDNLMNTQLKTGVCLNLFSSDHLVQNKHKSRHDVQFVPYTACPHCSHEYCELKDRIVIVLLFLKNNLDDDNFHAHLQTCSKFSELFCFKTFLLQFSVRLRYSSTRCVGVIVVAIVVWVTQPHKPPLYDFAKPLRKHKSSLSIVALRVSRHKAAWKIIWTFKGSPPHTP